MSDIELIEEILQGKRGPLRKQEYEKFESILKKLKALEVIKNKLNLEVYLSEGGDYSYYLLGNDFWDSINFDITEQEYELLAEALENE